jgi:hypothetical protein
MKRINSILATIAGLLSLFAIYLLCGYCCEKTAKAQDPQIFIPDGPQLIANQFSPMDSAASLLEKMYLIPVTYEDAILSWPGDLTQVPNAAGDMLTIPKRRSFTMPDEANPHKTPTLDAGLLRRIVDAYQAETDGPRFRVYRSRMGLHLIPDQVRDRNGRFIEATPFLDTVISIPVEKRTPSGHVRAICNAISASSATGIELHSFPQFLDNYFSWERISRFPTDGELGKISFSWGADQMAARDALIDLLEGSATTLTWRLYCDAQAHCALNVLPIEASYIDSNGGVFRRPLFHDKKEAID